MRCRKEITFEQSSEEENKQSFHGKYKGLVSHAQSKVSINWRRKRQARKNSSLGSMFLAINELLQETFSSTYSHDMPEEYLQALSSMGDQNFSMETNLSFIFVKVKVLLYRLHTQLVTQNYWLVTQRMNMR